MYVSMYINEIGNTISRAPIKCVKITCELAQVKEEQNEQDTITMTHWTSVNIMQARSDHLYLYIETKIVTILTKNPNCKIFIVCHLEIVVKQSN